MIDEHLRVVLSFGAVGLCENRRFVVFLGENIDLGERNSVGGCRVRLGLWKHVCREAMKSSVGGLVFACLDLREVGWIGSRMKFRDLVKNYLRPMLCRGDRRQRYQRSKIPLRNEPLI